MGFTGQRAQAHAPGAEPLTDALHALHLIQGKRRRCSLELEQIAQRRHRTVLKQAAVGGEMVVPGPLLHSLVQGLGHLR